MADNLFKNRNAFRIILLVSCFSLSFWIVGQKINVYRYKAVGAIFEILWLPVIFCIIAIPVFSFYFWRQEKFKMTSKFLYLFSWSLLSIFLLYLLSGK
jgi:hypothetical protein